jgi:hypothetical protein
MIGRFRHRGWPKRGESWNGALRCPVLASEGGIAVAYGDKSRSYKKDRIIIMRIKRSPKGNVHLVLARENDGTLGEVMLTPEEFIPYMHELQEKMHGREGR